MALGEPRDRGPARLPAVAPPPLGPEEVARRRFDTSFRGFDQQEVRAFLAHVADELARLRARHDELRLELDAARAAPPPPMDRESLMAALGEETARIVRTAEEAAEDIRAKAEETGSRIRTEAVEEAEGIRSEASVILERRREEAEAAAAERARVAEEEAQALLAEAAWRAQEMVRDAEATRSEVLADLADRRRVAHLQVERLGAGRDRLLEAYAAVRQNLDAAVSTLDEAPEAARHAAEAAEVAARRQRPQPDSRLVPPPPPAEVLPPDYEPPAEAEPEPAPEPAVPLVPEAAPLHEPEDEPEPEPAPVAEQHESVSMPEPSPALVSEPESEPDPDPAAEAAFALLRAERTPPSAEQHLQRRDVELDPLAGPLARRLKRSLQDEQNDVLDRLRNAKSHPSLDGALGTEDEQVQRYAAIVRDALQQAAGAGARAGGERGTGVSDIEPIASAMAYELARPLRRGVTRALEAADGSDDEQVLPDGVGAAYREWRSARIEKMTAEHLAAAYVVGVYNGGGGAALSWVVDDGGDPCPDCEDNALAGPTPHGELFPTGQAMPPAHPGCRCLVVPMPVDAPAAERSTPTT